MTRPVWLPAAETAAVTAEVATGVDRATTGGTNANQAQPSLLHNSAVGARQSPTTRPTRSGSGAPTPSRRN